MASSLIFVALAAAWLVVLVPMFARRRQEVVRTTDAALAARVVRRGQDRVSVSAEPVRSNRVQEAFAMPDTDRGRADMSDVDIEEDFAEGDEQADGQWRQLHSDDVRAGRRYRPGRGGFDPEAAALAARTKYARRQRWVLSFLAAAVVTAVLALLVAPVLWWLHAVADLSLVGYLTYLRRQVRIEDDIRQRRLARLSNVRGEVVEDYDEDYVDEREYADEAEYEDEGRAEERQRDTRCVARRPANAVVLDIDDEDPMFDELDERTWEPYRRAVGE